MTVCPATDSRTPALVGTAERQHNVQPHKDIREAHHIMEAAETGTEW
jgi:hypothetical protein